MSVALAIFVKTPGHSPIKTRLAAVLGDAAAQHWHAAAAAATAAVVARCADVTHRYWAVAEDAALAAPPWRELPRIAQGEGGLGTRMARVHRQLVERHGAALLIGADAPQLDADPLARAARWLAVDTPRGVLGPATDGGFWLVGSNRALPTDDWEAVPYSRGDTAACFRRRMAGHADWLEIDTLRDVDRVDDLPALLQAIDALPTALPEQCALAALSRTLLADVTT